MDDMPCRVLLVEDNEDGYFIVRDFLADVATTKFDLAWVSNYQAARESLTDQQYDVCFICCGLGEATSMGLAREFGDGEMPFILLTGNEDYEVDVAATKAGVTDYLVKSHINAPLLERAIRYSIERKKTEAALLQAQRFAQATVDSLPANIAVINEQGTIVAVNASWNQFAASNVFIGAASSIGTNYLEVCDQSDDADGRVVAACIRAVIAGEEPISALEYPCDSTTTRQWFQMSATRFFGEGPLHIVVAHENITERKRLESAQHFLASIVKSSKDSIVTIDFDRIITSWNKSAEQLYGYAAAEAIGKPLTLLTLPEDFHELLNNIDRIRHSETVEIFDTIRVNKDGREINLEVILSPVKDMTGRVIGISTITRDITKRKQAEESLRESEARFQSIVANVPGMVYQFMMQSDGSISWPFVGQGFREIFEMEPEPLTENPYLPLDKVHPEDREEFDRSVMESRETVQPRSWEGRLLLDSGKIKWIQVTSQPHHLPDGSTLWNGLVTDSSYRKEAETERDHFFTLSLDMLAIADHNGFFKRLNPAFEATLGHSNAELMAKPFLEWVHPDDREATLEVMKELDAGASTLNFTNRYRCSDDSYRWLSWVSAPFEGLIYAAAHDVTSLKNAKAALQKANNELELRVAKRTTELEYSNATLQSGILELERAEEELRARVSQQEAVAELGHQVLTDVDIDTLMKSATQLVSTTLNVKLSTILELMPGGHTLSIRSSTGWEGDDSTIIIPDGHKSQAGYSLHSQSPVIISDLRTETRFEPSQAMLDQGICSGITVVLGSLEQPFGTFGAHAAQHRDFTQDDVHFLQSISNVLTAALEQRHIHEQLRIENIERQMAMSALQESAAVLQIAKEEAENSKAEADAANLAKSEFLSRMSHELRTPLNAILGFGQLLEMRDLKPRDADCVAHIVKGGKHLLGLINEVLDIARVEAGHVSLSLETVGISEVLQETLDMVALLGEERGIRFEVDELCSIQTYVFADRQRLKQILINLCSNAVKYNREGGRVIVSCKPEDEERVRLEIKDSGYGIAPEDLKKLFTPFERLNADKTGIEGTGLGLVLSDRLAEAMGGTLEANSIIGVGSTFSLVLPIGKDPLDDQQTGVLSAAQPGEIGAAVQNRMVLAIEDNPANFSLLEMILESRPDVRLIGAAQGGIGLELARQHCPDLILLDLHLPDIQGVDVLQRLREFPKTQGIPVVVLSADATPSQIRRLLEMGVSHYLTKPFNIEELLHIIDEMRTKPATSEKNKSTN